MKRDGQREGMCCGEGGRWRDPGRQRQREAGPGTIETSQARNAAQTERATERKEAGGSRGWRDEEADGEHVTSGDARICTSRARALFPSFLCRWIVLNRIPV